MAEKQSGIMGIATMIAITTFARQGNRVVNNSFCKQRYYSILSDKCTIRPIGGTIGATTHIRNNDTSIRLAPDTIETGGVPAVCVALGQATVLRGYDAVPTAAQNIPFVGVRGKYDKLTK